MELPSFPPGTSIDEFLKHTYPELKEKAQEIRALQKRLQENEGKVVLLEFNYSELIATSPQGCFGGGDSWDNKTILSFGIIQPPHLIFPSKPELYQHALIPVAPKIRLAGYTYGTSLVFRDRPSITPTGTIPLSLTRYLLPQTLEDSSRLRPLYDEEVNALTDEKENRWRMGKKLLTDILLLTGEDQIDERFKKCFIDANYREDRGLEGKAYEEIRELLLNPHALTAYLDQRQKTDQEKRNKNIRETVYQIAQYHREYVTEAQAIRAQRKDIPSNARRSAQSAAFPGEITAVATMARDFEELFTMNLFSKYERLEERKNKIQYQLAKALEENMHTYEGSFPDPITPGVSITPSTLLPTLLELYFKKK